MQRAGRAGREVGRPYELCVSDLPDSLEFQGPGFCYRLYPEAAFRELPDASEPEILRCSLASATLRLKCLERDFFNLELLDSPNESAGKSQKLR